MNTFKKILLVGFVSCGMAAGVHAAAALDDAELAGVAKQIWDNPKFCAAVRDLRDGIYGLSSTIVHGFPGSSEETINRSVRDYCLRLHGLEEGGAFEGRGLLDGDFVGVRKAWSKLGFMLFLLEPGKLPELELGDITIDKNIVDQFIAMGRDDAFKLRVAVELNRLG